MSQSAFGYEIIAQPIPALDPAAHPYAVQHDFYYRSTGSLTWTKVTQPFRFIIGAKTTVLFRAYTLVVAEPVGAAVNSASIRDRPVLNSNL